jgi:hypothetical protein
MAEPTNPEAPDTITLTRDQAFDILIALDQAEQILRSDDRLAVLARLWIAIPILIDKLF